MPKSDWFKKAFSREYLSIYHHRDKNIKTKETVFAKDIMQLKPTDLILDLCCGDGTHVVEFHHLGIGAVGFDLSLTLLRNKNAFWKKICGDMRRLPFKKEQFDGLTNFFTSFGYFEADAENILVLKESYRILKKKHFFLFDYFNIEYVQDNLVQDSKKMVRGNIIIEERKISDNGKRLEKKIKIKKKDNANMELFESVRIYSPDEISRLLENEGFEILRRYGSFDQTLFHTGSRRLILLCQKK